MGRVRVGLLAAVFLALPFLVSPLGITTTLASEILIFSLFATGFNLLLGYTGVLSFGHAAFFGLGAFSASLTRLHLTDFVLPALLAGVLIAGIAALLIGMLIIRKRGIYFALLTLAFGQMFYTVAFRWTAVTGGENGLSVPPARLLEGINLGTPLHFYYFTLLLAGLSAFVLWRIVNSPFGRVLQAIRENERRAECLGFEVRRYKLAAFTLSGLFTGLAGSLYAFLLQFVFAETLHWSMSGSPVIMTLIGGMGSFFGPTLGAGVFVLLKDLLSSYTKRWMLVLGSIFIFFVLASPEGLSGVASRERWRNLWPRR